MTGIHKRSVTLAGHRTSLTLEGVFWELLQEEARRRSSNPTALIAEIDSARAESAAALNLSSAVRVWLVTQLRGRTEDR